MAHCAYCKEKLGKGKLYAFCIYLFYHQYWSNILIHVPGTYEASRILKWFKSKSICSETSICRTCLATETKNILKLYGLNVF